MRQAVQRNFVLQQGFEAPAPGTCTRRYAALQFQPRIVLMPVALGVLLQASGVFFALSAVLWWCAAMPRWHPFDGLHRRIREYPDAPAPAPRQTAQTMAGAFAAACGVLLWMGWARGVRTAHAAMAGIGGCR